MLSGLLVFTETTSGNSNTPDCPVYWKIDTSSPLGEQQLKDAKARLGINMSLEGGLTYYRNPSGQLGPLKSAPRNLNRNDVYLYGDTRVEVYYKVQVKGCSPVVSNYNILRGTLKSLSNINGFIEGVKLNDWIKANENRFSDFIKIANFEKCFTDKYNLYTKPNPDQVSFTYEDQRLKIRIDDPYFGVSREFLSRDCGIVSNPGYAFRIIELQPECLWRLDESPAVVGFSIPLNQTCEYGITVNQPSTQPNLVDVLILQRFTIDAKNWRVKIKCTNSRQTRLVNGLLNLEDRAKCPKGFRRVV